MSGAVAERAAAFYARKASAAVMADRLGQASGQPVSAMLELVDRCNEACVHCYQVHGQHEEMSTEEVFGVLDQLAEMGVLFVTLSGGEPTLRKDFLDIVAYARRRRFAVKVFSNGLRIDDAMADRLADLAVQEVQLSLYAHEAARHDAVTRVPGSWERTVAAARRLLARGIRVVCKTPLMRGVNAEHLEAYVDFVRSLGADVAVDPELNPREDGDRTPQVLASDGALRLDALRGLLGARGLQVPSLAAEARAKRLRAAPCGAASGSVHVEADGSVEPCTLLSERLGDARAEGVARAWSSERARLLRSLTHADLHGCRDCDLLPWCQHCYANALREVGDALGPHPSACARARARWAARHGRAPELLASEVPGRDPSRGPYRIEGEGRLRPIEDVVTEEDRALARKLGWMPRPPRPASDLLPADLLLRGRKPRRATSTSTVVPVAAVEEER